MDDFLRRVIARREAEQELRINTTMGAALPPAKGEWRRHDKKKRKQVEVNEGETKRKRLPPLLPRRKL